MSNQNKQVTPHQIIISVKDEKGELPLAAYKYIATAINADHTVDLVNYKLNVKHDYADRYAYIALKKGSVDRVTRFMQRGGFTVSGFNYLIGNDKDLAKNNLPNFIIMDQDGSLIMAENYRVGHDALIVFWGFTKKSESSPIRTKSTEMWANR